MPTILKIRKTYKYRLYSSKNDFYLHEEINIAGRIWNHITALQDRFYRLFKKHISLSRMQKHIAKLRMESRRYAYWNGLGSQSVQEICERHEAAYQRFFKKQGGRPRFKKVEKFRSFVLKQAHWKLGKDTNKRGSSKKPRWTGRIIINETRYKFVKHRPMTGDIKTITIKRDAAKRLWIYFSVIETIRIEDQSSTGKIGGFDFGLRTFLTTDEGESIKAPLFFKADLPQLRKIHRQIARKVEGSKNQIKAKNHLARRQIRIADKRRDFHYKQAHQLCDLYDVLVFEDLNIASMKSLWGRKISDLGFKNFLKILESVAFKRGKQVILIDRWDRSTGKCSRCGHHQKLELRDRVFLCEECGLSLDRDHNAAKNILALGYQRILHEAK